jgi:hypothetical protein
VTVLDGMRYLRPYLSPLDFFVKKRWWGCTLRACLEAEYKNPAPNFYERLFEHDDELMSNCSNSSGGGGGEVERRRVTVTESGQKHPLPLSGRALAARLLNNNDRVVVQLHRHEPPVPDLPIEILHRGGVAATASATMMTEDDSGRRLQPNNSAADAAAAAIASASAGVAASLAASTAAHEASSLSSAVVAASGAFTAACTAHTPPVSGLVWSSEETLVVNKPAGIPVHASGRYQWNTVVGRLRSEHGIEAFRQ